MNNARALNVKDKRQKDNLSACVCPFECSGWRR